MDGSRIRRPPLKRGKVSPRLEVPMSVPRPPYVDSRNAPAFLDEFQIQDAEGIKFMRASGQLAARVRDFAGTLVKVTLLSPPILNTTRHSLFPYCNFAAGIVECNPLSLI